MIRVGTEPPNWLVEAVRAFREWERFNQGVFRVTVEDLEGRRYLITVRREES